MGCIQGGAPTTTGPARHDIYFLAVLEISEHFIGKYNHLYNQQLDYHGLYNLSLVRVAAEGIEGIVRLSFQAVHPSSGWPGGLPGVSVTPRIHF
jgi:hypothetical protein